jgi:hypothetical protein
MSRFLLSVSLALAAACIALFIPNGLRAMMFMTMAATAGTVVYYVTRCHHSSPGLLPPTTGTDGTRVPARWFCDECGKIWGAGFDDRQTRPIARYSGYDESKPVAAARRAEVLVKQQRELAVRRAGGMTGRPRKAGSTSRADVVRITDAHRMAK